MMRLHTASLPLLGLALLAAPAAAQDHSAHQAQAAPAPTPAPTPTPAPADPHAGHAMPMADPPPGHPEAMEGMDHSTMDHSAAASPSPGPEMETPPPPEAGIGPPRAADAIWGADAMRASRGDLRHHGDFPLFWFQADRAEFQAREGADGYLWDVQGYYGGPTSRFWFKSEGEGSFGERIEDAEIQALFSRAIGPFFDLQAGVRQDLAGPETTHAVLGIQGLAPYMFEVDAAVFLSHRGDLTARFEAELDQRITQRLILQPRAEFNLAAQDVPQLGIGAGLDTVEVGIRLRYEIIREFAPYIGIEQSWRVANSADYARAAGEDPSVTNFVAGIRFWF
ncbi:copper resistance protein B [Altererythrobacter buctensis]|uniref:Copper resistance protein B n=2 Tax=Alteraurantiacibacter buctensis TaxID=1503981 RepID=A0A844Z2Y9_9SPHN|nr:copper resistance protein B [Alteraurantiacibacter buctensis]MXO73500.1 copper resistance protein B [Alteraurantiacibacter buctensis]